MKFVIAVMITFVFASAIAMLMINIYAKRTHGISEPYFSWASWRPAGYGLATSVFALGGGFLIMVGTLHLLGVHPTLQSPYVERIRFDQQIAALRTQMAGLKHQVAVLQQKNQLTRH